jgi:hypothetical protein
MNPCQGSVVFRSDFHLPKSTPAALKALGRGSLPDTLEVEGRRFVRRRVFKHDFFAATALYEADPLFEGNTDRVILKVQRQASFLLFPLRWIGRILTARECGALERLVGVPGIPRLIGEWGSTGLVREYIEGHTLAEVDRVDDDFHPRLRKLIDAVHARDMAYVDLEKPGNVLIGDNGRPYLFDFQISWHWPRCWGGNLWPARAIRRWLQKGDLYHLVKLQRRTRPDQLSPEVLAASYRKPWFVRTHNVLTRPFTRLRRRILNRLDPQRSRGERGRISDNKLIGGA